MRAWRKHGSSAAPVNLGSRICLDGDTLRGVAAASRSQHDAVEGEHLSLQLKPPSQASSTRLLWRKQPSISGQDQDETAWRCNTDHNCIAEQNHAHQRWGVTSNLEACD